MPLLVYSAETADQRDARMAWWREARSRFAEGQRYLEGRPWSPDEALRAFTGRFTRHSARILALAKRAIDLDSGLAAHLHRADELYLGEMMQTQDAREGLAAFLGKRAPAWTHT